MKENDWGSHVTLSQLALFILRLFTRTTKKPLKTAWESAGPKFELFFHGLMWPRAIAPRIRFLIDKATSQNFIRIKRNHVDKCLNTHCFINVGHCYYLFNCREKTSAYQATGGLFPASRLQHKATQALQGGVNQNLTFGLVFNISSRCKLGIILCDYKSWAGRKKYGSSQQMVQAIA